MSAGASHEHRKDAVTSPLLLRELYFNRIGVLFLLMLLVSVGLLIGSARTDGAQSQFWLAVGTSLLATTVFASVQVLLTTRQFDRFLRGSIQSTVQEQISAGTEELSRTYQRMQVQFVPNATYPGVDDPEPRFNRDLNASVRSADQYTFRGVSGQYAVARLAVLTTVPPTVSLILADPTKPSAVDARARRLTGAGRGANWAKVRGELQEGIYLALAGIHTIGMRFDTMRVCLTADPQIDRVELTEKEVYFTRFSDAEDPKSYFPATMRFGRESLIHQIYSRDCARMLTSRYGTNFEVPRDSTDEQYLEILAAHGVSMTAERLAELTARFEKFRDQLKPRLVPSD